MARAREVWLYRWVLPQDLKASIAAGWEWVNGPIRLLGGWPSHLLRGRECPTSA